MLRRSMAIGSIAVLLATGGCTSDDKPSNSGPPASLCERIGTDALRKVMPSFQPDAPGEGDSTGCVRLADASPSGDFLRITIEDPSPGTDEECAAIERDGTIPGTTWMPPDHLKSVGDFACGTVVVDTDKSVVVNVLARRGGTHVSVSFGRPAGAVDEVREAVIELARTVMQRA